jgi:hypothetical protein
MTHWIKDSGDGLPIHPIFLHHPQPTLHEVHYASHIAALEDKIVQRAVTALLNAIYEEDFLGFSYGFRPGRSAHDAMDALCVLLTPNEAHGKIATQFAARSLVADPAEQTCPQHMQLRFAHGAFRTHDILPSNSCLKSLSSIHITRAPASA